MRFTAQWGGLLLPGHRAGSVQNEVVRSRCSESWNGRPRCPSVGETMMQLPNPEQRHLARKQHCTDGGKKKSYTNGDRPTRGRNKRFSLVSYFGE